MPLSGNEINSPFLSCLEPLHRTKGSKLYQVRIPSPLCSHLGLRTNIQILLKIFRAFWDTKFHDIYESFDILNKKTI